MAELLGSSRVETVTELREPESVPPPVTLAFLGLIAVNAVTRVPGVSEASVADARLAIFLALPAGWLLVRCRHGGWWHWRANALDFFFVPFAALVALDALATAVGWAQGTPDPLLFHSVLITYYYLAVRLVAQRRTNAHWIVTAIVASAILQSALAIAQYAIVQFRVATVLAPFALPALHRTWFDAPVQASFRLNGYRSVGTFFHANLLATYLTLALPLALAMAFAAERAWHRRLSALTALLLSAGLVCAGSRGAFLSIAVSGAFVTWRCASRGQLRWIGLGVSALVVIGLPLWSQIADLARVEQGTSGRSVIWANYAEMVSERPLLGSGLGAAHRAYIARYGYPSVEDFDLTLAQILVTANDDDFRAFHAHNLFLHYAADMGIPTAILLLAFYLRGGYLFWRDERRGRLAAPARALVVGGAGMMAGNFVHSFFDTATNFYDPVIGLPFVAILAVMEAGRSRDTARGSRATHGLSRGK